MTITAPAAAAIQTESPVTIAGTITEPLSAATSVTCNGQPGTLQGNTFSCSLALMTDFGEESLRRAVREYLNQ